MAIKFETERDLEDCLMENTDFLECYTGPHYSFYRQMNLGPYGIADIVGICSYTDPDGRTNCDVRIIELKNTPLAAAHVAQLARYKSFFERVLQDSGIRFTDIRGILVGLKTFPTADDLCYLVQNMNWLTCYEMNFCPFAGLEWHEVGGWRPSADASDAIARVSELVTPPPQMAAANEA